MTASQPDNEAIFHAARDIPDPDRRRAYVREASGGDEARIAHIEALLAAAEGPDSLLDRPAADMTVATIDQPSTESPGTMIGPYKLIEPIGEGGMGSVWMAQQTEPVKRLVAVKLIKAGMDSRQVIARFEAERQALALMDHPNIARVLDGGTSSGGRPYFVMDLVKGVPITRYCDEHHLTPRERLELFIPVCQAVQHAHQKGIIHRDLKPSNALVALYDGKPVPKIIDFGVAKAAGQQLTDKTLVTGFGAIVGTLEYMSPEQAEVNQIDIDTRSDIYSLGVLLYELLTGSLPFSRKELTQAAMLEMLRVIREQEPTKPSTKLSTADGLPTLAANRGTDPAKLTEMVRGELDWIVMKALEKDRNRRYQTANSFAMDVERYLADEPVEACPPSAGYRLRKFARKNRSVLATVGAFVLLLAAATLASTWQAVRATLAESRARHAQDLAVRSETKARRAQELAQRERGQAVTNLYHARVEEAAALRRARGMGYRTQAFNLLQQALELDTPDKDVDRLRNEAVACMGDFVGLEPITWENFPAGIRQIALTPRGEEMAIALDNGTIELRQVSSGGVVKELSESAVALGIDPANRWLVTGGSDGTIKVWPDYATAGGPAAQTINMRDDLAGMAQNGRFAVAYSQAKDDGFLSLWDVARREVKARLKLASREPVGRVQVSDDGQTVAVASHRRRRPHVLVWNTPAPEPKEIISAETDQAIEALSISPDGRFLACQHGADGLILLDLREATPRPLIRSHVVLAACFSQDGRFLVYDTIDGHVSVWDVSHHQEVAALAHPRRGVTPLAAISASGNTFATGERASHTIRFWKLAGSGEKLILSGHDGGVACVVFSPDGKVLASGSRDRLVKLWDTATGRLLRTLPRFDSQIQSIAFSPDGRLLATGQIGPASQPVQVWDLRALQASAPPDDELGHRAYGIAFSPDGKVLAACGDGLTLWRVAEGVKGTGNTPRPSFKRTAHLPGQRSLYLRISANGKLLAWVDHNSLVCLWDLASGREIPFMGPPLLFGWHNLAFYPDSDHLTFRSAREMLETWDTHTARRVSTLGHGTGAVAATPDGRFLVAGATDNYTESLWSSQTGSRLFSFPQESGVVWSRALSPNGEHVAFGLADGGLAIWNVPKIQAQLAEIGLAWRADAAPAPQQEPEPFVPATLDERKHQLRQYSNLGKRLASMGRVAEAEQACRTAVRLMPDDPVAHADLGKLLEDQARHQEADAELNEAIKLQPEDARHWVQRGWADAHRGEWQKALADYDKAIELSPNDANLHNNLAWNLATHADPLGRDPGRALKWAKKAVALEPKEGACWRTLGIASYRAGDWKAALAVLEESMELRKGGDSADWFFLAMCHEKLDGKEKARNWYDKAVAWMAKHEPNNDELRRFRAETEDLLRLK